MVQLKIDIQPENDLTFGFVDAQQLQQLSIIH